MATNTTIVHEAGDKKAGMTLGELTDFITEAQRAGIPTDVSPSIDMGWGSQLKKITVVG